MYVIGAALLEKLVSGLSLITIDMSPLLFEDKWLL